MSGRRKKRPPIWCLWDAHTFVATTFFFFARRHKRISTIQINKCAINQHVSVGPLTDSSFFSSRLRCRGGVYVVRRATVHVTQAVAFSPMLMNSTLLKINISLATMNLNIEWNDDGGNAKLIQNMRRWNGEAWSGVSTMSCRRLQRHPKEYKRKR